MMNASMGIQIIPDVNSDSEVIRIVDEVIDSISKTGLNCFVGPLETAVEGDLDQLIEIIRRSNEVAEKAGAEKISTYVKIVYRPKGKVLTIEEKTEKYHR